MNRATISRDLEYVLRHLDLKYTKEKLRRTHTTQYTLWHFIFEVSPVDIRAKWKRENIWESKRGIVYAFSEMHGVDVWSEPAIPHPMYPGEWLARYMLKQQEAHERA